MIHHGDLFDVLPTLEAESIDACVTDPPYNLEFMGKSWDSFGDVEDAGFAYWLSGLIDGEGCFSVAKHTRGTYAPRFTLKLRADEEETLRGIQRRLSIGQLHPEEREPNPMVKWSVSDMAGCQRLVDLLDKYPLRAKKRLDYATWREAVCEWSSRPRGNRWHGSADNTRMAALRDRLMRNREYVEVAWSGNPFQDWCRLWAREVYRVMKPGGYLLSFGGTRTYHRMAAGLEDAGFEIRDSLTWIYGQGFPKNFNLGDGKGTALKPAHEPIALAWKPFKGTIKACHETHGTAALNIDACRIGADDFEPRDRLGANRLMVDRPWNRRDRESGTRQIGQEGHELGRWPANVILDEGAAAELDAQTGELRNGGEQLSEYHSDWGEGGAWASKRTAFAGSIGGASRFYYVAKPSREERDMGCYDLQASSGGEATDRKDGSAGLNNPRAGAGRTGGARNIHPTVKPVELMRWLVRLVTPIDGVVIDPFTGSGTTGMACAYEQRRFIGIEREAEYVAIAERRIRAVAPLFAEEATA